MACSLGSLLAAALLVVALCDARSMTHLSSRTRSSPALSGAVPNTTRYFTQQLLDHFEPSDRRTWTQRYFVNESFFDPATGPVFLCVGGEGPPLEPTVRCPHTHVPGYRTVQAENGSLRPLPCARTLIMYAAPLLSHLVWPHLFPYRMRVRALKEHHHDSC